ncbi:MAG: sulfite exporter TauE/SafE family protein [Saprospiraceae bacterium]|nr:sulfite exporter TauE/SafE family protein [Saprospiraceae bacterium]
MDYLIICGVALFVSGLTFISGFGLGTLLMPAFALFFPLPVAIGATAIVHLVNNLFKVGLIGGKADRSVVVRFAVPGFFLAILGAYVLGLLEGSPPINQYNLAGKQFEISQVNLIVGILIIIFALFDLLPALSKLQLDKRHIVLGGALSGFFGGLSGHQGALRTTFLIKFGLEKEVFIATGIVSAVIVDVGRLLIYGAAFYSHRFEYVESGLIPLVVAASLSAFAGAYAGRQILKKVTFRSIQILIGILLILVGSGLASGIL